MCTSWADGRPGYKTLQSFSFSWLHRLPNIKDVMLLYFGGTSTSLRRW